MKRRPKTYRLFKKKVLGKPFLLILVVVFVLVTFILRSISKTTRDNYIDKRNNCQCLSSKTGEFHEFCYQDPQNSSAVGKQFNCVHLEALENLNVLGDNKRSFNLSESIKNESHVVFVSATSDDHFDFSMSSFKCIRQYYPDHKYILYGLDLSSNFTDQLPDDPNFEFRVFDASPYPDFVKNWKNYHFKGLVLAEAVKEFPVIWWIDANIALRKPNIIKNLFSEILEYRLSGNFSSIISFRPTDHSNFAVLNPDLLNYFPSNDQLLQKFSQVGSGILYVARTEFTLKILKW
ncbi:hypothetical protein GCK72_018793 [Caenorhabditis remanei]|uniref:Uncharacterized protein n=1 Tax=Caenorhabditis remanei TaxID=31234 RepID=A0A6A5GCV5_CAERE|nr:hypothetical protein GCK72_018793 [Caenorhabditis remanei]KAF1752239.1 hypothetical protein GCK72_018793 [Caenorhabditis remanei]